MPGRRSVDPHQLRAGMAAVAPWLAGGEQPDRATVASAVRLSLRTLAQRSARAAERSPCACSVPARLVRANIVTGYSSPTRR